LNDELLDYKLVSLEEAKIYDGIEGIYEELELVHKTEWCPGLWD